MKRIKHMICNAITKLQNKDEKQYQPIVFLNSPISDETEDVLGIKSAADAIVEAVGQSANMIGLIADYGAGKSSLTSMLAEDKCHFRKVIHINMWDTISGLSEKSSNNDAVGALTKSFVFQLAAGVSENTARYVNRRLSRNFGIISFSLSSLAFWVWFVAAALCYGIYAIINSIDVAVLGSFIRSVNGSIAIESATVYAEMSKSIAPVFPVIGVILLLLGLRNTNVAYSYWKTNNLEPEINDIFEAYYFIYKRLLRRKKHTLIVIEDLDRISDRALVVGFLREVYRFGSIVPPTKKNAPVFLIAVMPEVNLTNRKSEISEEQSEEVNSLENKNDHEAIYEKLFDYTVSLRPIHYEDYADIMLDIIGSDVSDRKKVINELLDEKKIEDNLPSSFNWLIKGHNLTMRQLKERLNAAMALLVTLKNKGYANQSFVSFSSCSAVAYLEHQYPELFYTFIARENELSTLVQKCYTAKNSNDPNCNSDFDIALEHFFNKDVFGENSNIENMQNDVKEMLMCGDIADDFRMYFYSFPKHSYIKNGDERDIYNLLMRPKEYPDDADLDEKVERLVSSKKTNVIEKALVDIADRDKNFPKIILKNKYLFKTAFATSAQAVLSCARSYISWNPNKLQDSQALAEYVFSYGLENFRDFWESYSYWLSCSFPEIDDKTKVDIRGRLISIFGDNIEIFRGLYEEQNRKPRIVLEENAECSEFVLITEKELTLIPSRDIAISLINIGLIQDEDIEYVSSFLNKEPATNSSYEKALSVYKHISSFSKSTDHWEKVITFLKGNRIIDVELFSFALSGIMEESEEDRSVIGSYLCEIQHDRIPDRYFELVDEYLIDKNLPDVVTDTLFEKQMLTSLVSYCADKGILSRYDFTSADYCESILESCQRLKKDRLDCMVLFRHEVLRQYLAINDAEFLCNKLDDLFYGEFPCISNEEMDSILDAITILKLLNRSKVTAENYLAVVEHLNSVADGTDVKDFFRYLLSTEFKDKYQDKAVVNKIIDELDYKKLCFEDLGEDDISEIIKYIKQYRDFNNFEVANSFMLLVNCLIPELEKVVAGRSVSRYVDAILQIGKPSDFTLSWIEETNVTFALPEEILDYLLQSNNMQKYLIGKVLLEKQFTFPYENVSDDIVLREYYPESPIWEHIKDNDFLIEFILKNEKYKDFDSSNYPENLLPLYKGKQTAVFAKHVLEHTNGDSQRNYLLNMGEICDEDNSVAISRLLIEDRFIDLLRDDELFERVYERLWENAPKHSGYKSFFSRKRNERVKDN